MFKHKSIYFIFLWLRSKCDLANVICSIIFTLENSNPKRFLKIYDQLRSVFLQNKMPP